LHIGEKYILQIVLIQKKKTCDLGAINTYSGKMQLVFSKRVACILGAIFTSVIRKIQPTKLVLSKSNTLHVFICKFYIL
jgi:hypothetical protein